MCSTRVGSRLFKKPASDKHGAMTIAITTFSIITLWILGLFVILRLTNTQHNDIQRDETNHNGLICDTQHNGNQHIEFICDNQHNIIQCHNVMLNVALSIAMLSVIRLSVVVLNGIRLSVMVRQTL